MARAVRQKCALATRCDSRVMLWGISSPAHCRIANLMTTALQTGMSPERIRDLAECGQRRARQLGVQLPDWQH